MQQYHSRFLGKIQVKGKTAAVGVYELYDGDPQTRCRNSSSSTAPEFERGLQHYFAREFVEAAGCFKHVLTRHPDDHAAKLYLERAAQFMVQDVPEDWQGVETMESK